MPGVEEAEAHGAVVVQVWVHAKPPAPVGEEANLRWLARVVARQEEVKLEQAIRVRRVGWAGDECAHQRCVGFVLKCDGSDGGGAGVTVSKEMAREKGEGGRNKESGNKITQEGGGRQHTCLRLV